MVLYDERVAKTYDNDREGEVHWQLEQLAVANYFKKYTISSVLDIPIGTGRFIDIYQAHGVTNVLGIDISPYMLSEAKKRVTTTTKVTLEVGDAFTINREDNAFDLVVCFRLLHLFPNEKREALLRELLRVGRKVLLQVYVHPRHNLVQKTVGFIKARFVRQTQRPWSSIPAYPLYPDELQRLIADVGAATKSIDRICDYEGTSVMICHLSN